MVRADIKIIYRNKTKSTYGEPLFPKTGKKWKAGKNRATGRDEEVRLQVRAVSGPCRADESGASDKIHIFPKSQAHVAYSGLESLPDGFHKPRHT